jgi:hypothetical protein
MVLNMLMLLLLIGLFGFCVALVRFADGIVNPQAELRDEARREPI